MFYILLDWLLSGMSNGCTLCESLGARLGTSGQQGPWCKDAGEADKQKAAKDAGMQGPAGSHQVTNLSTASIIK